jgi:hypothetical protein
MRGFNWTRRTRINDHTHATNERGTWLRHLKIGGEPLNHHRPHGARGWSGDSAPADLDFLDVFFPQAINPMTS